MNPWLIVGLVSVVWIVLLVLLVAWLSRGLFRRPPNPPGPLYDHEDEQ